MSLRELFTPNSVYSPLMNPGFQSLTVFTDVNFNNLNVTGDLLVSGTTTSSGFANIGDITNSGNLLMGGILYPNGIENTGLLQNTGNMTNSGTLVNTGNLTVNGTLFAGPISGNSLFLGAGANITDAVNANAFTRAGSTIIVDNMATAVVSYSSIYNYADPHLVYMYRGTQSAGTVSEINISCNIYGNTETRYQLVDITNFVFPYTFNPLLLVADELVTTTQNSFLKLSFANLRGLTVQPMLLGLYVNVTGAQNTQTYGIQVKYGTA